MGNLVYVVWGLFAAFFAWFGGRALYLRWWGIATTGTIVALPLVTDSEGDTTCRPVVAFTTAEGVRLELKSIYGTAEASTYFRVGQRVTIRYAAKDPTCFGIDGYEVAGVLWLGIIAAVGVVIAFYVQFTQ